MKNYYIISFIFFLTLSFSKSVEAQLDDHIDFGETITDLSYHREGEFEFVSKLLGGRLELYRARVIIDEESLLMYVIFFPESTEFFYDYVFFKKERNAEELKLYFLARWKYLIEGLEKGYIHFEENPLNSVKQLHGTLNIQNSTEGLEFGNTHFSHYRLSRLRTLVDSLNQEGG